MSLPRLLIVFPIYKFCEEIDTVPDVTIGDIVNSIAKANAKRLANLGAYVLYHGDDMLDPTQTVIKNGINRNSVIIVKRLKDIQQYA